MVHNKCESNLFLNQKWQNRLIQDWKDLHHHLVVLQIYLIQNHLPPQKSILPHAEVLTNSEIPGQRVCD